MEVDLKILSDDNIILSDIKKTEEKTDMQNNKQENIDNQIIKEVKNNIKNNHIYSQSYKEDDYSFNLIKKNNNEYLVELKCEDKIKEEIKTKINSCIQKEQILNSKKEEFQRILNNILIDENSLKKKLISLIGEYKEEYDETINQITEKILDYENFKKEALLLQEKVIKYRSSTILQLLFKIFWRRFYKCIVYILEKYMIFLYNEKYFNMTCKILHTLIQIIVDELYGKIFNKISDNKIFLKHKADYTTKIQLYRDISYYFFIFKHFDKDKEKMIFTIDEDFNFDFSENTYDNVGRFNYHILKRTGLNFSLELFKERINNDYLYYQYLKKLLFIYQRYKIILPTYKKSTFLYD